ncbi:hypothetical protein FQN57_001450 [Myotisia sp. PD_48]|nr:hypothetical protein FQN57_001450 [Myotisia sp. PD_48]
MSSEDESSQETATKILLCGGIAGIVTWASVFPLDVIKTRLQAQSFSTSNLPSASSPERQSLLRQTIGQSISHSTQSRLLNSVEIARNAYHSEGLGVFYRGIGVCSLRAFIVNAVQWATYEWIMRVLNNPKGINTGLENVV